MEIQTVPVPDVGPPGEMELEVSACGVCGSDIHMRRAGRSWAEQEGEPHTGHEFCGVVTDPGDSASQKGNRVVFWANLCCGECDMCRAGQERLCREAHGTNPIGFVCNDACAERFEGRRPTRAGSPTPCPMWPRPHRSLMVACRAIHRGRVRLCDKVLVVGSGIIGRLIGPGPGAPARPGSPAPTPARATSASPGAWPLRPLRGRNRAGRGAPRGGLGRRARRGIRGRGIRPGLGRLHRRRPPGRQDRHDRQLVRAGDSVRHEPRRQLEMELIGNVSRMRREFGKTVCLIDRRITNPERFAAGIAPLEDLQAAIERQADLEDPMLRGAARP